MTKVHTENACTFTIFTPTFNRAHLLPRAFASIAAQTFRDFEWVVVDDGSKDDTKAVVAALAAQVNFPIRYFYQKNGGIHVAINAGVVSAKGEFFIYLNDDDRLAPDCLERMLFHWRRIPDQSRPAFVGVAALCCDAAGNIIGTPFPKDVFDCDALNIRIKEGIKGDKIGMNRTEILRRFPFPEDMERPVPEALIWNRIAREYRIRFVNETLAEKEYLSGGMTDKMRANIIRSPGATVIYHRELIQFGRALPLSCLAKSYANYIRFSLHARSPLVEQVTAAPSGLLWGLAFPVGYGVYLRDRLLVKS